MNEEKTVSKSILVVEDDADIRNLYVEILDGEGFRVLAAESGEAALKILNELDRDPCLILTDFMMPGMSGAELVKIIKKEDLLMSLPIVMISARPLGHEHTQGIEFLKKPLDVETIIAKVKEYCGPPYTPRNEKDKEQAFRQETSLSH